MIYVIDTNIWVKGTSSNLEYSFSCNTFLITFLNSKYFLAVDGEGTIIKEYSNYFKSNIQMKEQYNMLHRLGRILFYDSKIPDRHKTNLIEYGFTGKEDQVFVGVSMSTDNVIVSEDSDFGKGNIKESEKEKKERILKYMTEEMGLYVLDSIEAYNHINSLK